MNRIACERVRETLRAFVAGELDDAERAEIEAHVARCQPCAAEVTRERTLTSILEALPEAPSELPEAPSGLPEAPELPSSLPEPGRAPTRRPIPLVRAGAWAAAAAIVVALASWRTDETRRPATFPATFARIVDVDDARPGWDERTLELVAGAEAVAMRRPAESR